MTNSIVIKEAIEDDLNIIQEIAFKTWPVAYKNIISDAQIDYMLGLFYSRGALIDNISNGHKFLLAYQHAMPIGFASYEHNFQGQRVTRIPKIYVHPEAQGKGVGKKLIDAIEKIAIDNNSEKLSLNVNRSNKAQDFYNKVGFEVVSEEDIALEHGYLMEDFVMEKRI